MSNVSNQQNSPVLVFGGGHSAAIVTIPMGYDRPSTIIMPPHDEGGSTGKNKLVWGEMPGFGDVNKNLILALTQVHTECDWDSLLNKDRAATAQEMQQIYTRFLSGIQSLRLPQDAKAKFLEDISGLPKLIDYYYTKVATVVPPEHLSSLNLLEAKDSLGNLFLVFLYQELGSDREVSKYLSHTLGIAFDFRFPFKEPTELWAKSRDEFGNPIELRSEGIIDIYPRQVEDLKTLVKNQGNKTPTLTKEMHRLLETCQTIFLAPGSPENYEVMFTPQMVSIINRHRIEVVMIAPLFRLPKDRPLNKIIADIASRGIHKIRVWLPAPKDVIKVIRNPEALWKYEQENKEFQMLHMQAYESYIKNLLAGFFEKEKDELIPEYAEIYNRYLDLVNQAKATACPNNVTLEMNQRITYDEANGYKHDTQSLNPILQQELRNPMHPPIYQSDTRPPREFRSMIPI